jgi:hypothetical protein
MSRAHPVPGFDLHRESLTLPPDVWSWLEDEATRTGRTRSDVATEALRGAKAAKENTDG